MSEDSPGEPVDFPGWLKFDDRSPGDAGVGPARAVEVEGRCRRCWGSVAALRREDGPYTHVECLVCGASAEGEEARREVARMLREAAQNVPLARLGRGSKYSGKARFVIKLLPDMDRDMAWYECVFRTKPITDSGPSRSPIPVQTDHPPVGAERRGTTRRP